MKSSLCLWLVVWSKERWWFQYTIKPYVSSYMARLAVNASVTTSYYSTADWLTHSAPYPAGSRGHQRPRRLGGVSVISRHGVCSPAGGVWADKLDWSSSSCSFHIRPAWPDRLVKPRLPWDRPVHLNTDGWWGTLYFSLQFHMCSCDVIALVSVSWSCRSWRQSVDAFR